MHGMSPNKRQSAVNYIFFYCKMSTGILVTVALKERRVLDVRDLTASENKKKMAS